MGKRTIKAIKAIKKNAHLLREVMTEKVCRELLRKHYGRVAAVAEEAKVSRMAVYAALRRHDLWAHTMRMRAEGCKKLASAKRVHKGAK